VVIKNLKEWGRYPTGTLSDEASLPRHWRGNPPETEVEKHFQTYCSTLQSIGFPFTTLGE
jgi:hypothetical protein